MSAHIGARPLSGRLALNRLGVFLAVLAIAGLTQPFVVVSANRIAVGIGQGLFSALLALQFEGVTANPACLTSAPFLTQWAVLATSVAGLVEMGPSLDVITDLFIRSREPDVRGAIEGASKLAPTNPQEPPADASRLMLRYADRMPAAVAPWWPPLRAAHHGDQG